jgi:hypothetical protein
MVAADLARAQQGLGPTGFDWLVEIIAVHSEGGKQQQNGVELVLT